VSTRIPVLVLLLAGVGGCGGTTDDRDPTWGYISPVIVQPNCATSSCHSKGDAVAGLDFSTDQSGWNSLRILHLPTRPADCPGMGMPCVAPEARPLVTPGNPDESRIMNMLRAEGARRMPPDRPLAEADIQLIGQWILQGALNN
jgi:hypothetical protein